MIPAFDLQFIQCMVLHVRVASYDNLVRASGISCLACLQHLIVCMLLCNVMVPHCIEHVLAAGL